MTETVKILSADWDDNPYSYIFQDVADLFWPGDYSKSNHEAQARIIERMVEKGCTETTTTAYYNAYDTPQGLVWFDSESGTFNVNAGNDAPLLYVKTIIDEIKAELDAHREALR